MPTDALEIFAPAKINLYLEIMGKRPDGYHELRTVMQKVGLYDRIVLSKAKTDILLHCPGSDIPEDETNLASKAANAFFKHTGIQSGVAIELFKEIPVAAGLGGGSSDAAYVLLGLNRLFNAELSAESLLKIAGPLGADVPFFVLDAAAALGTGIGDKLEAVEPMQDCQILLVNPGIAVSTKWVYDNFALTSGSNPYMLSGYSKSKDRQFSDGIAAPLKCIPGVSFLNDLEAVTIQKYNQLLDIKKTMIQAGAKASMMSGSGPTIFAVFNKKKLAEDCLEKFSNQYKDVFLVDPIAN